VVRKFGCLVVVSSVTGVVVVGHSIVLHCLQHFPGTEYSSLQSAASQGISGQVSFVNISTHSPDSLQFSVHVQ